MIEKKQSQQYLEKILDLETQSFNRIEKSIFLAFERTGLVINSMASIQNICHDLKSVFPNIKEENIIAAIKEGALGAYGRTYRMSSQEICIWVRSYLKANPEMKHTRNRELSHGAEFGLMQKYIDMFYKDETYTEDELVVMNNKEISDLK